MRRLIISMLATVISITLFATVAAHLQRSPVTGSNDHRAVVVMVNSPEHRRDRVTALPPLSRDKSPSSLHYESQTEQLAGPVDPVDPAEPVAALGYMPANRLTIRPFILTDIDAMLPATFYDVAPQRLVLRLLINQYGDVDQVVVEESALPQILLAELQAKFLQARFSPGRLAQRAVASALRIEVHLQ